VSAALGAAIDAALAARARLRGRPVRETAAALARAARAWREDAEVARALPEAAHLSPPMVRAVLPLLAEPLDEAMLCALHAQEGDGGVAPGLVATVLASNVPGLALPAIAHACLAGAAVVVKSGRDDTVSAPAFRRALDAADPLLAATVVTTTWPGGSVAIEDAILPRADVVVATGADATVAALARRYGGRVLAYGDRTSIAVVADRVSDEGIDGLAWDVVRYEQRGCLSPQAVLALGDAESVAARLLAALVRIARTVPAPALATELRAAHRLALEEARFAGATVLEGDGATVVVTPERRIADGIGRRTVRVHALDRPRDVVEAFAAGTVECIGVDRGVTLDVEALRARGVARICPLGRMQRPRIDWPRGQRPALASLFRAPGEPRIQVEP
jgi:acyl-CoA reductase-like NAD-dependent aldehyde dehydrogenase